MKIKAFLFTLLILFTFNSTVVEASQLPKQVRDYLTTQKKVPTIRFDGVVTYDKDLLYIPVFPANPKDVDSLTIAKTYPANKKMDFLPDVVIFNNGFALLKVTRVDESTVSVNDIGEWPVEIKTGLIPQDILVPHGLVLPESLAGIIGDVQIPLVGSAKKTPFVARKKGAPLPSGKRVADTKIYNVPVSLKNKLYFVNNFQTEYLQVFSSTVSEPLFSLKTSGVMKDVKPVLNGEFLLVATTNKKNLDVVDIKNEYVAKHIDLTSVPSEIVVDDINKKAYVASIQDESLSIIDLSTMTMKEKIQLVGAPQRLAISKDGSQLAYVDMKTSNIYILDLKNDYTNKLITNYPNTTKILLENNVLYIIARTSPALRVVYFDLLQDTQVTKTKKDKKKEAQKRQEQENEEESFSDDLVTGYDIKEKEKENVTPIRTYASSIVDVAVGNKPLDLYIRNNKVYVLCAADNSVHIYNPKENTTIVEKLPVDGFSKAFSPVPNSNLAVITNMANLKYVVFDMDKNKSIQTLPINEYINSITILERNK